jgi:hypothetical protein
MSHVQTSIEISAEPHRIWSVLTEFSRYPEWNPLLVNVRGQPHPGERVVATLAPPDARVRTFHPVVVRADPTRELAWRGWLVRPRLILVEHTFKIRQQGRRTHFCHSATFYGIALRTCRQSIEQQARIGLGLMNWRMKRVAEAGSVDSWRSDAAGKLSCDYDWKRVNQCRTFHDVAVAIEIIRREPRPVEQLPLADWFCGTTDQGAPFVSSQGGINSGYKTDNLPRDLAAIHPVLLGSIGGRTFVIDGAHRLAKAVLTRTTSIPAVRLTESQTASCIRDGFHYRVQAKYGRSQ